MKQDVINRIRSMQISLGECKDILRWRAERDKEKSILEIQKFQHTFTVLLETIISSHEWNTMNLWWF